MIDCIRIYKNKNTNMGVEKLRQIVSDGIESSEVIEIWELQKLLVNLSDEDRQEAISIIEDAERLAQDPAKQALRSLKLTLQTQAGLYVNENSAVVAPVAQTIETAPVLSSQVQALQATIENPPVIDFLKLGISQGDANKLGAVLIPDFSPENIKSYSIEVGLAESTEINPYLYVELASQVILKESTEDTHFLDPAVQNQLELIIKNRLVQGKKSGELLKRLGELEVKEKNNPQYAALFQRLNLIPITANPQIAQAQAVMNETTSDGRSILGDVMDLEIFGGNISMRNYLERHGDTAKFILFFAYIFAGNLLPGFKELPLSGSFLGRLGTSVGFLALGGGDLINKVVDKIDGGVTSTYAFFQKQEIKDRFNATKEATIQVFQTYARTIPGIDFSKAGEKFSFVLNNFKSTHAKRAEKNLGTVDDENFMALTRLTELESFANISKTQLQGVDSFESLSKLLSTEDSNKLANLGLDNSDNDDIVLYIKEYFLPELGDHEFVWQMFGVTATINAATEALSSLSGNIHISSPEHEAIIRTNFANILNSPNSSELAKRAAQRLYQAAQFGDILEFNLNEYATLTDDEKIDLQELIDQMTHVFEVQEKIQTLIQAVHAIKIITSGNLPDTKETLEEKYHLLVKAETELQTYMNGLADKTHGIKKSDFSISEFETAFQTKKQEIFEYAGKPKDEGGLGLNAFAGVDIVKEREALKKQQEVTKLTTEAEKLISQIEDVPTVDTSPIEMRKWYDKYKDDFGELEKIKGESSLIGNPVIAKIDTALGKMKEFEDNYTAMREAKLKELTDLETEIKNISIGDSIDEQEYNTLKTQIHTVAKKYNPIIDSIIEGTLSLGTWESIKTWFRADYSTPKYQEKNSIIELDTQLGNNNTYNFNAILPLIEAKNTELEAAFSVDLDIKSLDITNSSAVLAILQEMRKHESIVSGFFSDHKKTKLGTIKQQAEQIEQKYIKALAEIDDINALIAFKQSYNIVFNSNEFKNFWDQTLGKDPFEVAYEKRMSELEAEKVSLEEEARKIAEEKKLEPIYGLDIRSDEAKPVFDIFLEVAQKNDSPNMRDLVSDMQKDPQITIKEFITILEQETALQSILAPEIVKMRQAVKSIQIN